MSLNEDFIGQNLENQSWLSTKFFFKTKKYTYRPWSKCKKNQKNPGTGPVPGPKVIFTTICTLKNTLSPGTGAVPGFFLFFFLHFFMVYNIFFIFEKKFGGQPTLLFKILSNKIRI